MAIIRPIAAICSAIVAGLLVGRDDASLNEQQDDSGEQTSSCCSSKAEPEPVKASC
jgi:hypothetical protein